MDRLQEVLPIFTIGYGSRSIEQFIDVLKVHQIAYLIDVRSAPYSRYKPEFSKEALDAELGRHGIRYVYMGDTLGGHPDNKECYDSNGKVDYDRVKKTENYQVGINRLQKAVAQKQCVALMCSEGKPENCHRSKLIGETLEKRNVPITHIDENNEPQSQMHIIDRLTGGQMPLFGEDEFQSRKRYQ